MTYIPWLDLSELDFPKTYNALKEPNGLLAVGGDLSTNRIIAAYRQGIFPWYEEDQPILWWSPSPRVVLFPDKIHISRSLAKTIRRREFQVTCDQAFAQVINHCAKTPRGDQLGTWITNDMNCAYNRLYNQGVAHSIEVWKNNQLVGGLYGLAIGKIFFGESMFSLCSNASKIAFVTLAQQLETWGFAMIDCQVSNPHLLTLGAQEIDRLQFEALLKNYIDEQGPNSWDKEWRCS